jgi:ribosomal protein S6--L-glutamate ligase
MTTLVALVSGSGWHVADLKRAARDLDVALHAVPFPQVSASVGLNGRERTREGKAQPDPRLKLALRQARPPEPAGKVPAAIESGGLDLTAVDGVLVRMMPPGSLEQVVFRMDALHRLAALGVPVLNPPRAVEVAVDKYLSLALLEAAGLPVPPTWTGQSANEALAAFDILGGDVVVKPLFGSEGRGLMRLSDKELAWRAFHALERLGSVLYLQRVVRHPGHDVRVFVLGGSVLGVMRRYASPGEWRANVSLGGRAENCRLDPEAERLALAAAGAIGAELAGIDLMYDLDRGGLVVIEINAVPGWRALASVTGIDIAAEILKALAGSRR